MSNHELEEFIERISIMSSDELAEYMAAINTEIYNRLRGVKFVIIKSSEEESEEMFTPRLVVSDDDDRDDSHSSDDSSTGKDKARTSTEMSDTSSEESDETPVCHCCGTEYGMCTFDKELDVRLDNSLDDSIITEIPWTWVLNSSNVPYWKKALRVLQNYQPERYEQPKLVKIATILLMLTENAEGTANRAEFVRHIFRVLRVNVWFMEKYERFRQETRKKVIEMESDTGANEIAREFSWIKGFPFPQFTCAYCGETCVCTEFDGTDHFCCTEHLETFMMNGDSPHRPHITKKLLDTQLDEYMSTDENRPVLIIQSPATNWDDGITRGDRNLFVRVAVDPNDWRIEWRKYYD